MKMKRFTWVLGVIFMGGVLITSMTSCGNATDGTDADTVVLGTEEPASVDDAAVDIDAASDVISDDAESTDSKCGGADATDATDKAAEKEEILKGEVEAPMTDKEKELSKNDPIEDDVKTLGKEEKAAPKKNTVEKKCGGK